MAIELRLFGNRPMSRGARLVFDLGKVAAEIDELETGKWLAQEPGCELVEPRRVGREAIEAAHTARRFALLPSASRAASAIAVAESTTETSCCASSLAIRASTPRSSG
jgi:hypothetical protein